MAHAAANSAVIYDSTSDAGESDASTCEEGHNSMGRLSIMARVRSLQQENTVLKIEVDTLKLRCKNLKEENEELRRARVNLVRSIRLLLREQLFGLFASRHSPAFR